jgi:hypothetical protein
MRFCVSDLTFLLHFYGACLHCVYHRTTNFYRSSHSVLYFKHRKSSSTQKNLYNSCRISFFSLLERILFILDLDITSANAPFFVLFWVGEGQDDWNGRRNCGREGMFCEACNRGMLRLGRCWKKSTMT